MGYKVNVPYLVFADPEGVCGNNLEWHLDLRTQTLTISGYGDMYGYRFAGDAPWYAYREKIKTVVFDGSIKKIGLNAFLECDGIETVYYSGTVIAWRKYVSNKNLFREADLYINGELHEHSFTKETVTAEPSCTRSGSARLSCECGDYCTEVLPAVDHTPGEWMNDDSGKLIKICTECELILETVDKEPEEIPDEEITLPETEEIPDNAPDEPAQERGVLEHITEIFEKIAGAFEDIFGFISEWFKF